LDHQADHDFRVHFVVNR